MLYREKNASPKVIGALKEIRLAWGLSREDLSERCGVSPRAIYYVEAGHRSPTLETLELWADALGYEITLKPKGP
jgi:transcriptional regulator with XRE-family HTH domain